MKLGGKSKSLIRLREAGFEIPRFVVLKQDECTVKNILKIIDKNFYTRYGEIDLIAKRGDEIFFIEVKTRTSIKYGYPETAVNRKKINHLLKAVHIYINIKKIKSFGELI